MNSYSLESDLNLYLSNLHRKIDLIHVDQNPAEIINEIKEMTKGHRAFVIYDKNLYYLKFEPLEGINKLQLKKTDDELILLCEDIMKYQEKPLKTNLKNHFKFYSNSNGPIIVFNYNSIKFSNKLNKPMSLTFHDVKCFIDVIKYRKRIDYSKLMLATEEASILVNNAIKNKCFTQLVDRVIQDPNLFIVNHQLFKNNETELEECPCEFNDFSSESNKHSREKRSHIEKTILEYVDKKFIEKKTTGLNILSFGSGNLLQDFMIIVQLIKKGYSKFNLFLVDLEYKNKGCSKNIEYFQKMLNALSDENKLDLKMNFLTEVKECDDNIKFDLVYEIDLNVFNDTLPIRNGLIKSKYQNNFIHYINHAHLEHILTEDNFLNTYTECAEKYVEYAQMIIQKFEHSSSLQVHFSSFGQFNYVFCCELLNMLIYELRHLNNIFLMVDSSEEKYYTKKYFDQLKLFYRSNVHIDVHSSSILNKKLIVEDKTAQVVISEDGIREKTKLGFDIL